jgi:hypothetical protein
MNSKLTRLGLGAAMLLSLTAMTAGTAFADAVHNSGDTVDQDTVQLNWTGNGTPVDQKCGDSADPGHLGYENGATADNYMLWIFSTDGGSTTGAVTITINGTTYSDTNDGHQIVTPFIDPSTINTSDGSAHTNFVVATTGGGAWILTISHGCDGEQDQLPPTGMIQGPCADPAYYAVFDNSGPTTAIKFRFSWYNNSGYNVVTKVVPAGMVYTTFQHWAKPGTVMKVGYKDPNTGVWTNLAKMTSVKGSYPACDVTPGFSQPS